MGGFEKADATGLPVDRSERRRNWFKRGEVKLIREMHSGWSVQNFAQYLHLWPGTFLLPKSPQDKASMRHAKSAADSYSQF